MKKTISAILCLVMLVSCFTCLSLTAGAADATQYLKASATQCINDQITVNVKVAKGQSAMGAVVFFEYDPAVLAPVTGGTASAASAAEEQHGAKIDSSNVYSVAFTGNKAIGSTTADTAVLYATFKVVSANRPKTTIKVSCDQLLLDSKTLVRNSDDTAMAVATLNVATIPTVTKLSVANNGGEGLTVKWDAVAGVSKYRIYRCEIDDSGKALTKNERVAEVAGSTTSYKDTDLEVNTRYKYCVLCVIGNEAGEIGTTANAKYTTSLAAPAKIAVNCGKGCMNVSWSAVSGATKYRLERRTIDAKNNVGEWTVVADVTTNKYTDISRFERNYRYDYRVRAIKNSTYSAFSGYDRAKYTCTIPVITAIAGQNQPGGTVRVYWRPVSGITTYRIYRCELNPDNTEKTAKVRIGEVTGKTEFIDTAEDLKNGASYKYCVLCAVGPNSSDVGDTSKVVYNAGLTAPTGVSVGLSTGSMKITWKAVAGVTTYRVYKRMVNADNSVKAWEAIADVNGTSYIDTSRLERNYRYDYCVSAVRGDNEGPRSERDRAKYVCNIPVITAIAADHTTGDAAKVYWRGVSGITKYRVYRCELNPDNTEKTAKVRIAEVDNATSFIDTEDLAPGTYKYCVLCAVGANSSDVGDTAKFVKK